VSHRGGPSHAQRDLESRRCALRIRTLGCACRERTSRRRPPVRLASSVSRLESAPERSDRPPLVPSIRRGRGAL
jgi:hypothetical protein